MAMILLPLTLSKTKSLRGPLTHRNQILGISLSTGDNVILLQIFTHKYFDKLGSQCTMKSGKCIFKSLGYWFSPSLLSVCVCVF